jgi:hypothetical protein
VEKPSVGRFVHYSYGTSHVWFPSTCRTAVITEVDEDPANNIGLVGLCVFNPTGLFFHPLHLGGSVHDEKEHVDGSWHWPERV